MIGSASEEIQVSPSLFAPKPYIRTEFQQSAGLSCLLFLRCFVFGWGALDADHSAVGEI